jgi:DNA-directed RNA polymerase specialized sigma24 family protein
MFQTLEMASAVTADVFQVAVAVHHRRLAGLAFVLTGDRQVAEDLVAEAYARV